MINDFKFYIPLQKQKGDWLSGIASTLNVDRDMERMSENALEDMKNQILNNGINLFGNHEHNWENTLGIIKEANLMNNRLGIKVFLDNPQTNPKVDMLLEKLKRGINLGLSVGGAVTKEREEYSKELGRKIKVIDGVKLYEVSVVGIPSNTDAILSIPKAIMKCFKMFHNVSKCPVCYSPLNLNNNNCKVCLWRK